jgi:hypothetical protein
MPDIFHLVRAILAIDVGLLIFNILPIYPLDGGQILRSLLWFVMGRARSLMVATILGIAGVVGIIGLALFSRALWLAAIAFFMLMNCWGGLKQAQALLRLAKLPRRLGYSCPVCKTSPPIGDYWRCGNCPGQPFDTFATMGTCPSCRTQFPVTMCLDCGRASPVNEWSAPTLIRSSM